jgi:hypothetical protein
MLWALPFKFVWQALSQASMSGINKTGTSLDIIAL